MRLVIPDIPKSPNGPRGLLRMHWAARKRYWEYWRNLIRAEIDNSHEPCQTKQHVSITQIRQKKLDPDNLIASCKPILDALVAWTLIKDDSPDYIELSVRQDVEKGKFTIVVIEDFYDDETWKKVVELLWS